MTQQYDNTNKGIFSKNDRKSHDAQPDYRGVINIEGVEYYLSGWIKVNRQDASKRFISLSIQPKQQAAPAPRQAPARPAPRHDAAQARQTRGNSGSGFDDDFQNDPF